MKEGIFNPIYLSEEMSDLLKGKQKTDIKLKYDYDSITKINNKYCCGKFDYDDYTDESTPCLHPSYISAERCMKKRIDYLNSICPICKDKRMIKDCDNAFHRLPRVKLETSNWRVEK